MCSLLSHDDYLLKKTDNHDQSACHCVVTSYTQASRVLLVFGGAKLGTIWNVTETEMKHIFLALQIVAKSKSCAEYEWLLYKIHNKNNSKFTKFSLLGGELLARVICQDLSFLSLWEDNLLICNSCPILVLRLANIASCDQNVWQMQKNFFSIWTSRLHSTDSDRQFITISFVVSLSYLSPIKVNRNLNSPLVVEKLEWIKIIFTIWCWKTRR